MSKTIKIIDLLYMISKGEELPKRIQYKYDYEDVMHIFKLNEDNLYIEQNDDRLLDFIYPDFRNLNDTVEIIEEQEKIDIQNIEEIKFPNNIAIRDTRDLIVNQLVQAVKQLDKNIKEIKREHS